MGGCGFHEHDRRRCSERNYANSQIGCVRERLAQDGCQATRTSIVVSVRVPVLAQSSNQTYNRTMNKPFNLDRMIPMLADVGVSISDLKKNPAEAIAAAREQQVAILNRNRPVAYLISPEVWDHILDVFDDQKLAFELQDRLEDDLENSVEVSLDDL